MTDKRIIKTKQILKSTLIEMMKIQPFEKVKVKELCEKANTSKLTFYTHYDDKYALLQDIAKDMEQEVMDYYQKLQIDTDAGNDWVKHNQNLFRAIIHIQQKYTDIFRTAGKEENYFFFYFFYEVLLNALDNDNQLLFDNTQTYYPKRAICAFLITGMFGYIYQSRNNNVPDMDIYNQLFSLTTDLSKSNVFHGPKE